MRSPEAIREEARRLINAANAVDDPELKNAFATRAFDLSQLAEALEDEMFHLNLLRKNIFRYRSMLAGSTDDDERRFIQEALADAEELADNRLIVENAPDLQKLKPRNALWCIYQDWLMRRGDRTISDRRDIYPIDATFSLGCISSIDVTDHAKRFRYRLVSKRLTERLGYEMTGRYVDDIPDDKTKAYVHKLYTEAVDLQAPLYERSNRFFQRSNLETRSSRVAAVAKWRSDRHAYDLSGNVRSKPIAA